MRNVLEDLAEPTVLLENDPKAQKAYNKEIGRSLSSMAKTFDVDTLPNFEQIIKNAHFVREDWQESDLTPYLKVNEEPVLGSYQSAQEIVVSREGIDHIQGMARVVLESKKERIIERMVDIASSDGMSAPQRREVAESLQDAHQKISDAQGAILELESPSINISKGFMY